MIGESLVTSEWQKTALRMGSGNYKLLIDSANKADILHVKVDFLFLLSEN